MFNSRESWKVVCVFQVFQCCLFFKSQWTISSQSVWLFYLFAFGKLRHSHFLKWIWFLKVMKIYSRPKLERKRANMLSIAVMGLPWSHTTNSPSKWSSDKGVLANPPLFWCTWPLTALGCWIDFDWCQKTCWRRSTTYLYLGFLSL